MAAATKKREFHLPNAERGLGEEGGQAGLLLPPVRFTPSVEGWPGFDPRFDAQVPRGRSWLTHGRTSVTFMC